MADGARQMRSSKSKDEFFRKMKKKPAQQAVLDNIANYSIEQLENLRGNVFPKWVRQALVKIKEQELEFEARGGKTSEQVAAELAIRMANASLEGREK